MLAFKLFALWCVGSVAVTLVTVIALHLTADSRDR